MCMLALIVALSWYVSLLSADTALALSWRNESLLAPGCCHLAGLVLPLWYPWVGDHFGTSEAPWGTILAPRDHPGRPREQQDGHEGARNRIFIDLGSIFGTLLRELFGHLCLKFQFI